MIEYVTVWRDHEPTKLHWGVPVVRCRDCERYHEHGQLCDLFAIDEWDSLTYAMVAPDGFCAWGERKVEG